MKLKDSGWLEKLIKALKNWKEHATTYGSDSDESKAHGSDVMTLLFENAQHLDEYQRKFGASTISQQHILHFVSNADRFTSVEIKGMGGENDYLAFCEDGFLIADFEKWQENKAEAEQERQSRNDNKEPLFDKNKAIKTKSCWHSEDFTTVVWYGKEYQFNKTQALCVKYLWKNETASEKTIGEHIYSAADNYRLISTFRSKKGKHSAWGIMIVPSGNGIFALKKTAKK